MRLIKKNDDDLAAGEAMRGGLIGAVKYSAVALFLGGVLHATWPKFRAVRPPQKCWLMVAAALGGFGNGSDTAFTNFERRDREMQIRIANQKRHDILYGTPEENQAAAASLAGTGSGSNTTSASASA
ncbi:hypothetical protein BC939DRAFT_480317 [Gamsiella multidivaricata]|uniref:uncharacterized protein n=1 Tax=Gamsiella multidivaricata TaxID=101098 RepID=UPI0022202A09|nr:uncharacterized protein BC939DRAFT_480317 [Gamsiella multidivaricata]KAG0370758.1 hypothetical protein BGZ54_004259 [Gamsiella multidivaricata]KAI7818540.1 hypothetical protein BC939DRAFT_480317 [Gamsiella multidivaricata]